jgi:hypothetical protein
MMTMKLAKMTAAVLIMMTIASCSQSEVIESTPAKDTEVPTSTLPVETQESKTPPTGTPKPTATPTRTPTLEKTPSPTITIIWDVKMVPDRYKKYIGWEYPPYPDDFPSKYPSGWSVGHEWGIDFIRKDEDVMLWLSKVTYYEGLKPHWVLIDILVLPPLIGENERFIPNQCLFNGTRDDEIFVFATLDLENYDRYAENESIRLAWRANREKGAFESIPTDGIECVADNSMNIIR